MSIPILFGMHQDLPKKLSKRLRALREERGLTQEEAADLCKVPYKNYQWYESGTPRDMRLSTLGRIAKGFDMTASELLDFE